MRSANAQLRVCPAGRRWRVARGISFLEVVFATIILALTVATMAAAVNSISLQQRRAEHLLGCAEVANRLIIQYLDDDASLPAEGLGVAYGEAEYRWRKSITPVESSLDEAVVRGIEAMPSRQGGSSPDRLKKVAITVWLSDRSGGSMLPDAGAPQITVVRVVDPLAFNRRPPDSIENLMEQGADRLINRIFGTDVEGGGDQ